MRTNLSASYDEPAYVDLRDGGTPWGAWVLATLTFVVGDLATTMYGIHALGAVEAHPAGQMVLASLGIYGVLGAKALVILTVVPLARLWDDPRVRLAPPITLFLFGLVVTGWNLVVIASLIG